MVAEVLPRAPAPPHGPPVASARCDLAVDPLVALRHAVAPHLPLDAVAQRIRSGKRRRLVVPRGTSPATADLDELPDLVGMADPPIFLALEAVDKAPRAVLHALLRNRPPILLLFDSVPADGPAAELAAAAGLKPAGEAASDPEPTSDLPAAVKLTLRGLALAGPCPVEQLAAMLGREPLPVLGHLQQAHDLGVTILDDGEYLQLPAPTAAAMLSDALPSLLRAWTGRQPSAADEPLPEGPDGDVPGLVALDTSRVQQAMGRAHRAWASGAMDHGYRLAEEALQALHADDSDEARRLACGVHTEIAQVRHQLADNLPRALEHGQAALASLPTGDSPELTGGLQAMVATIAYDIGDAEALEVSLQAFDEAIRSFDMAGRPLAAARLLNDQAAVWVRLGDPVRATHLLRKSREVFASRPADDPDAQLELAETEHLLARLPLHARVRPGQRSAALDSALEHAAHAERTYGDMGLERQRARVWETRGRLHLLGGAREEGIRELVRASTAQRKLGDALGLAKTAAALSDALKASGRPGEAVRLLADSVTLNRQAGSGYGLEHNRRALDALLPGLTAQAAKEAAALSAHLDQALWETTAQTAGNR